MQRKQGGDQRPCQPGDTFLSIRRQADGNRPFPTYRGKETGRFMIPPLPAGASGHSSGSGIVRAQRLSHGTIACRDSEKSRRFYEDFLGLEVAHVTESAMVLRLGTTLYVACLCLGEKVPENTLWSHFGVNVASRGEVDEAYEAAIRLKEVYELRKVEKPTTLHGAYQFYLQDRDSNWWEIQYDPRTIDDFFALADRHLP